MEISKFTISKVLLQSKYNIDLDVCVDKGVFVDCTTRKPFDYQPTEAEIDAEVIRLQADYDSKQYARDRATDYPSIADQLDTLYHGGIDAWKAEVKVVKDKYPKGVINE